MTRMWQFKTANFTVADYIEPSCDPDLSWADDETLDLLERGIYQAFDTRVTVDFRGVEIGHDSLCESIYENPADFFREHIGTRGKYGSYFRDMVREAIAHARKTLSDMPVIRAA